MRPLSLPLPLRDTSVWGGFREAVPIPHRYGTTGGALLQHNASRTEFVWADHAVVAIDQVLSGGVPVGDWDWRNTIDATGHAVAIVRFGQPQDEGVDLIARGRGKRHPRSGEALTNPADVIADVLAIAGRAPSDGALADFRRECASAGIDVGGSIDTADSAQAVLRSIGESIGALVCADLPGWAKLWPATAGTPRATLRSGAFSASASLDALVNDLTMAYGHESGTPRASLRLAAPDSIARHGRHATTLDARWLTSSRVAYAVGARLLAHRARPLWSIAVESGPRVQVGDAVAIAHPVAPVCDTATVLARELNLDAGTAMIGAEIPVGDRPTVRLVSQSMAFDPAQYAGIGVETRGGERLLTLREESGAPIIGAAVTLDGTLTRYTDAAGRVSFPLATMPPGEHTLVIVTVDGRTLTTMVLIA